MRKDTGWFFGGTEPYMEAVVTIWSTKYRDIQAHIGETRLVV